MTEPYGENELDVLDGLTAQQAEDDAEQGKAGDVLGLTFFIPENPDPEVLAWPYFHFADVVELGMERLDEWLGEVALTATGVHRTMYLVDTAGGQWVAEGDAIGTPGPRSDADIRVWARHQHVPVPNGGRLPQSVRTAYDTWAANYLGPWPKVFCITDVPEASALAAEDR